MILLYFKDYFLNLKGLSDASAVSITWKEYVSTVHFLYILAKSLVLMSDEWFIEICLSSLSCGILAIKNE